MNPKPNDNAPSVEAWKNLLKMCPLKRDTTDRLIANYLLAAGYKETVEAFIRESSVLPTVDPCCLDVRVRIVELISQGCALDAAQLVDRLFPGLLENEFSVKFQLLQLHLIELIRAGRTEDVLAFAQTLAFEYGERSQEVIAEMERTLSLLIFVNPQTSPFGTMLEQSHRDRVARSVNEAILRRANQEPPCARMKNLCRTLLWCQTELVNKGGVRIVKMNDIASATLELE